MRVDTSSFLQLGSGGGLQFCCLRHRFLAPPEGRNGSDLSPSWVSSSSPWKIQPALTPSSQRSACCPSPSPLRFSADPLDRGRVLTLLWAEPFS